MPHAGRTQPENAGVDPIPGIGETPAKIGLQIARCLRAGHCRAKHLQTDFRLAQTWRRNSRTWCSSPLRITREVLIVDRSVIAEEIQQDDAREPHAIFRCALDFGLILIIHLAVQQLR